MGTQVHVRESMRKVDSQTWLLGGRVVIARSSSSASSDHKWKDDDSKGFFYSVTEVPEGQQPPVSYAPNPTDPADFEKVYDAGDAHVVWKVGNAFVKVVNIMNPGVTREHVTIAAVRAMSPSFPIPEVLYHGEWEGRYYLITSALPGRTLVDAWPDMDEATKQHCVGRIVEICNELAQHQGDYIGGVDSGQLGDAHLAQFDENPDLTHQGLLESSMELGMDCSTFHFYHCDLGPGNLIVGPDRSLGVIDWETAGYVPKDWIRTKFRVSGGFILDSDFIPVEDRRDWGNRVQRQLAEAGYPEVTDKWKLLR